MPGLAIETVGIRSHVVCLGELRPWMPWAQSMPTVEAELSVVQTAVTKFDEATDFAYFIVEPDTGELTGCAGLHPKETGVAEIGYWVRSDRHRRGYATDAARLLTRSGFGNVAVETTRIKMDGANIASSRVPRKLGYTLVSEDRWDRELTPGEGGTALTWTTERADWPQP
jgi:RimJ/RimL family protein N-acetyltransferase